MRPFRSISTLTRRASHGKISMTGSCWCKQLLRSCWLGFRQSNQPGGGTMPRILGDTRGHSITLASLRSRGMAQADLILHMEATVQANICADAQKGRSLCQAALGTGAAELVARSLTSRRLTKILHWLRRDSGKTACWLQ
mmetsp:Transcript_51118/g.95761  ORF Transcript_51118/g.95761 Transcript_51118/m.95761 type:complete len:140 (-) Transcript_51118:22-441(-)